MLPTVAASAAAARALGYRGLADLIEAEQLSPSHIATIFDSSASKTAARDCALIILAGAVARYRAKPQGWDGHLEEQRALEALASEVNPTAAFGKTSKEAAKLVARHWQAIAHVAA